MDRTRPTRLEVSTAILLAIGAIAGMSGSFVPQAALRQALWGLDGTALVAAGAILAVKHLRRGDDLVAAGFLVYVAGQTLVVSGAGASLAASVPSFAAGAALWAAALVILALPRTFPIWGRLAGLVAAALFAVTAGRIFFGETLLPTEMPLPSLGFPFLVISIAGWIVRQLWPRP
jgi:hypothetical protein